jgi:hypothetical protein
MNDRKMSLFPNRLQGRHGRMQSEEAVEIKHARAWDIDRRAHGVIRGLAMRYHDVESIGCAALEDHDKTPGVRPASRGSSENGARNKRRQHRRSNNGQCSVLKEYSASYGHTFL